MKVLELAFTCYAVTDMARARAFYEGTLGLTPGMISDTANGNWTEYEIGPHTLSIGSAPGFNPSAEGCIAALEMDDFDAAIAELKAKGVAFRMEPFPTPVCRMAMISDPDGNTICIHKRHAH
jgi:predicted enzyme related to lactoylglutathione lyase